MTWFLAVLIVLAMGAVAVMLANQPRLDPPRRPE